MKKSAFWFAFFLADILKIAIFGLSVISEFINKHQTGNPEIIDLQQHKMDNGDIRKQRRNTEMHTACRRIGGHTYCN
jgi:hypothetical protein